MPLVEILDGPPEWSGVIYESPEDMVADEIGLIHPRWRGTPVWVGWGALNAYRKAEVAGDRHRYRYVGPFGARPRRLYDGVEDLTGWDVLVVQQELHSEDRRKLWGSPVRVYAAPPGTPRPDPARPPEEQGWQELTRGGMLRRPRAPGTGAFMQQRLAVQMAEGNPWVVEHWQRLAEKQGPAKDAEVERIEAEQAQMRRVAEAVRQLRRLQPDQVRSWTSAPPFPARTTYVPMIGEELARIRGLGNREWMALQDPGAAGHAPRTGPRRRQRLVIRLRQAVHRPTGHPSAGSGDRARTAGLGGVRGGGLPPAVAAPHHHVRAL